MFIDVTRPSNDRLLAAIDQLRRRERTCTAELIAHLGEVERRQLYLEMGYGSLHAYLIRHLGYGTDGACKRAAVCRAARRVPRLLSLLAKGQLHLTGASLIATELNADNADEILPAVCGKTKEEIKPWLADRNPKPDVQSSMRAASQPRPDPGPSLFDAADERWGLAPPSPAKVPTNHRGHAASPPPVAPAASKRPRVTPLGRDRFKVTFQASGALRGKIERLQALMSHKVPSGDLPKVLEAAIDIAIVEVEKRRFGGKKPRRPLKSSVAPAPAAKDAPMHAPTTASGPTSASEPATRSEPPFTSKPPARSRPPRATRSPPNKDRRAIPVAVRRAVWQRDGGKCCYQAADGTVCGETRFLEFDHVVPVSIGGDDSINNLRLLCRAHNQHVAAKILGRETMAPFCRQARAAPRPETVSGADGERETKRQPC